MPVPTRVDRRSRPRLLIVEDDVDLAALLSIGLKREGYEVESVHDGKLAEVLIRQKPYDALIVDWMLPGQDGRTLVQRIREAGFETPVLMLTALTDTDNLVRGLDAGADDYLRKPYAFSELSARLRALTRRASPEIELGPLRIDFLKRVASVNGEVIELRAKEFDVLLLLSRNVARAVSREEMAEEAWGQPVADVGETTINMTVSTLRQKVQRASLIEIATVRGVGYRLVVHPETPSQV